MSDDKELQNNLLGDVFTKIPEGGLRPWDYTLIQSLVSCTQAIAALSRQVSELSTELNELKKNLPSPQALSWTNRAVIGLYALLGAILAANVTGIFNHATTVIKP